MQIGAYAVERDYSHYVAHAAKTILAIVGTASKGPVGVATICTSAQDFINKFGPLKTNCYGLYAGQYFLSQSSILYFVRAASESIAAATAKLAGTSASGGAVEDAISLECIEPGTFSNGYTITVAAGSSEDTYNISLKSTLGNTLETIKNITLDEMITEYATKYIKITAKNATAAKLTTGNYKFAGGNDGIDDITPGDYINAANQLIPETVDMNLFAVPGVTDAEVITAMLAIAENRGDCLYIVDPPKGLTREGVEGWHNGSEEHNHAAFNSSYGALYYDWINIYDSVNKTRVTVPPSVSVVSSIAYSDRISEPWFAPAGLSRGIIRGALESVTKLSKGDVEHLYSDGNNINAIYENPQAGLVIWGQKTLLRTDTALNRINVRRLMNYLKKIVVAACNYLTFEPNDRVTWNSFEMKVAPVLESIKSRRGIYEYRIIKGETIVTDNDIDNYRMPCMIMVRPTKAAEELPIYFTITSTGADFNEVLEANGIISE